uniref:Amine oxidase domain-containing protein n=1 Tax=Haptolina ericina TaxID=156174 RepID=A0A7S3ANH1_9EUKA
MQEAMEAMHRGEKSKMGLAFTAMTSGRLMSQFQNSTLSAFLDTCTSNVQLRAAITGQNGNYGIPPKEVSTMLHCGLVGHYFKGAYYPKGGGQRMSDRLAEVIEANGGSVHLRRKADHILVDESGSAVGVRTATRRGKTFEIRARAVVGAGDLARLYSSLLPSSAVSQEASSRVKGGQNAEGLLNTCIALDISAEELTSKYGMRASNYWCFDSYDADELYESVRSAEQARGTFGCYITSASLKDPETLHAPEGMSTVEVLTVVPQDVSKWGVTEEELSSGIYRSNATYKQLKAETEEAMVGRLEAQFPGVTQHITFKESSTPLSHNRFTFGGTAYGLAATPGQFMNNRHGFRGPVQNLFVCGHSTRTGHGIAGAMMGGQRVAGYVHKHLS